MTDYSTINLGSMILLFIFWGMFFLGVMGGIGFFLTRKEGKANQQQSSSLMTGSSRSDYFYHSENEDHYQHMWRTIQH